MEQGRKAPGAVFGTVWSQIRAVLPGSRLGQDGAGCSRMLQDAQPRRAAAPLLPAACVLLASHPLSARKHRSTVCLCNTFCKAFFLPIWETAVGFMAGRVYSAFTAGGGAGRERGAGRRLRARSGDVAPACCSCIPTSTASPTPKASFPPSGAAPPAI